MTRADILRKALDTLGAAYDTPEVLFTCGSKVQDLMVELATQLAEEAGVGVEGRAPAVRAGERPGTEHSHEGPATGHGSTVCLSATLRCSSALRERESSETVGRCNGPWARLPLAVSAPASSRS